METFSFPHTVFSRDSRAKREKEEGRLHEWSHLSSSCIAQRRIRATFYQTSKLPVSEQQPRGWMFSARRRTKEETYVDWLGSLANDLERGDKTPPGFVWHPEAEGERKERWVGNTLLVMCREEEVVVVSLVLHICLWTKHICIGRKVQSLQSPHRRMPL